MYLLEKMSPFFLVWFAIIAELGGQHSHRRNTTKVVYYIF